VCRWSLRSGVIVTAEPVAVLVAALLDPARSRGRANHPRTALTCGDVGGGPFGVGAPEVKSPDVV